MNNPPPSRNAVTVDVEDYFHASVFREAIPYNSWDQMTCRVERNTRKVLGLLAEFNIRGTFFVLGWVAEHYPALVREIQTAGHEIGCHGHAHHLVYELTPAAFRDDTRRALSRIEDASGAPVRVYRAASFSITERSLWALEILLEVGFTRDSSIFPIRNPLYGLPGAPRRPFRVRAQDRELVEFPLPVLQIGKRNFPVTGGAYLRLLPLKLQIRALEAIERRREPIVLYFHPWELDAEQPRIAAPLLAQLGHYTRLRHTEERLRQVLRKFAFGKLSELAQSGVPEYQVVPKHEYSGCGETFTLIQR